MSEKMEIAKGLLSFIEKSPSCYHVISNIEEELAKVGFIQLDEKAAWSIEAGKQYYTARNGSSIIAFALPKKLDKSKNKDKAIAYKSGFNIVAAHSDSPTFKVKENAEIVVEDKYVKLNTERYGGMIMSTWLDRPLSIAGRIAYKDGDEIKTKVIAVEKDLCVIPNLAIHMNRDINKGFEYNAQTDMAPLFAGMSKEESKDALLKLLAKESNIEREKILGTDLFLYVRDQGRIFGAGDEFILSPKLDDLQSVYAGKEAFLLAKPKSQINVLAVFDNEEVGSGTMQGADSTFLEDVLLRISEALGDTKEGYRQRVAGSFLVSADNAHAVHPNHPEKADPTNRPYLNGGIVIKYHGSQKYTTDAVSAARMKDICNRAGVPFQTYTNKSDIAGGSTLGNISAAHVSVASVDIGLPQLAMHSAVETGGVDDTAYAISALKVFFAE